jgi:hypothetical protein
MSFTSDLLTGLAQYLADAGVGLTYRADPQDVYLPDETGIFLGLYPTKPDRVVCLTAYVTSDEAKVALSHIRVEAALRGVVNDSLDVHDLGDVVFTVLQGAEDLTFGAAHVVQALRVISASGGVDDNKRSQRSDSYELDLDVPLTPGRPW